MKWWIRTWQIDLLFFLYFWFHNADVSVFLPSLLLPILPLPQHSQHSVIFARPARDNCAWLGRR